MPAKSPMYMKNAGGGKGNKKIREMLSTDMISAPLGDFRHMAHIGRGGRQDMFGDTSFISNQDCLTSVFDNRSNSSGSGKKDNGSARKSSGDQTSGCPGDRSSTIQSALSLPHLESTDNDHNDEPSQPLNKVYSRSQENICAVQTKSEAPPTWTERSSVEGPPKPKRVLSKVKKVSQSDQPDSTAEGIPDVQQSSPVDSPVAVEGDDGWKFELDMGPSLVDEIMEIMQMTRPSQPS